MRLDSNSLRERTVSIVRTGVRSAGIGPAMAGLLVQKNGSVGVVQRAQLDNLHLPTESSVRSTRHGPGKWKLKSFVNVRRP